MDAATLRQAMGNVSGVNYEAYVDGFNNAMRAAGITTVIRAAHWCAQIGHESVGLKYMSEIWGPSAAQRGYEGRRDLGNTQVGDGFRFRGSGPIQLTGRNNFRAFTRWANAQGHTTINFEADPDKVRAVPKWGFLAASWYWTVARPQMNSLCDQAVTNEAASIEAVTRAINGGTNGLADRRARYARAKALGRKLLPSAAPSGGASSSKAVEKVLDYSRAEIGQDTYYWCGPATAQLLLHTRTKNMVSESVLAKELGTTINGTNGVVQIANVLNRRMGGNWKVASMPNDPPKSGEKELLWKRIVGSINGNVGVAANIWVPPSNYPKASYKSTQNLKYSGGFVKHYLCVMGYAVDEAGRRHVWLADSGFAPYGSWVTFDQFATMIPPREYSYAADWQGSTEISPSKEDDMTPDQAKKLDHIYNQLTGSFKAGEFPGFDVNSLYATAYKKKFRSLTMMEAAAVIVKTQILMTDQLVGFEKDEKGPKFTGWNADDIRAKIKEKRETGVGLTQQEILQDLQDEFDKFAKIIKEKK